MVARVNGQPLYRRDFDAYLPEDYQRALTGEERKTYFDRWVTTQLLYEEAERAGMGVSREIESKLEQYKKDLVADRLVQEVLKEKAIVTSAEARAYYDAHKHEYTREVRVSHILVNTREDAEEVKEMLQTQPFSWVARRKSVDRHTGAGGDLGYLSKGNMLLEFEDVVFTMKVGDVSEIIESEFGYHVIKLTDVRESSNALPYEAVAEEVSRRLLLKKRTAVYDSLITALVANAEIDLIDPELRYAVEVAESLEAATSVAAPAASGRVFTRAVPEPKPERPRMDASEIVDTSAVADTTDGE